MNKTELINSVAEKTGLTKKDTSSTLEAIVETIIETVSNGEKVGLIGFGNFESRNRKAREGHNPQTGEKILIEAKTTPAFKPAKAFKESVNKGS